MSNLSGHYWFVWLRGKGHLTTIDIDRVGPNPVTLCCKSSLGRKGQTRIGDYRDRDEMPDVPEESRIYSRVNTEKEGLTPWPSNALAQGFGVAPQI
jgi:hypothetical protein